MTDKEILEIVDSILTKLDKVRNNLLSTEEIEYCTSRGYNSIDWHIHHIVSGDEYLSDVYNCLLKDYRRLLKEIENDNN